MFVKSLDSFRSSAMLTLLFFYKQALEFVFSLKTKRNYKVITANNVLDFITIGTLLSWLCVDKYRWRAKVDNSLEGDSWNLEFFLIMVEEEYYDMRYAYL